jgi:hypothetical protein
MEGAAPFGNRPDATDSSANQEFSRWRHSLTDLVDRVVDRTYDRLAARGF